MIQFRVSLTVLTVMLLALIGALAASAQSGGGYDLSWSSTNSGGHSAGDDYSLDGAAGQLAAGEAGQAGYTLTSGFWHPVCRPQAVAVNIAHYGSTVELTWTPHEANMAYDIYRSTAPYFEPSPANLEATVTSGFWEDPGAAGNPDTNYYYVVHSTCVGSHARSNDSGEFDFGIVPGQ